MNMSDLLTVQLNYFNVSCLFLIVGILMLNK